MEPIRMVDLKGQYEKIDNQVQTALQEVLQSTAFINGPAVQRFQHHLENYLDVKHVIPCANGTDALQVALMGLGLQPGDEVITADFTFAATAEVIALLGLTPVLVHLFGQAAPMEVLLQLAEEHKIFVVEDNAQGIGATYTFSDGRKQKTGTLGHVGTTSFFPSKNLGAYGDGGALFTNDDDLAHTLRGIVNHGMYQRYHHDVVGVNSRLDAMQAAILDVKLSYLDSYNEARKAAALQYNARLSGHQKIITPFREGDCDSHVYHQYTLRLLGTDRDAVVKKMGEKNIPTGVYYPIPLHAQKAYKDPRYRPEDFPVTLQMTKEVISLPMHTELSTAQIDYICTHLMDAINS